MKKVSTNNAPHYIWGGNCDGWHLLKSDNLSVIQESVPPGSSEIMHFHNASEQFFYVLSGTATLEIDSEVYILKNKEGCHVPAKTPHQLRNESGEVLNFLVVSTPPSHGDKIEA